MAKENQHIILDDDYEKKIIRREVERRRRTGMSTLSASLRSLLPFHLIKKIETLEFKRDRLLKQKQLTVDDEMNIIPESSDHRRSDNCVSVNLVPGGLEIDICVTDDWFLSDLISILLQQGCHVDMLLAAFPLKSMAQPFILFSLKWRT
ncbi:hypothetical protein PIB30_046531 [Stylosanthes scabra]|uniref:BHLH domain-containing protein n=1 Tax=Stylosanthes scabra TaxID=79078 RepID=A0ABU6RGT5_9FABA|nr:hypothetical protein [Stylosanthes scabra]